MVYDYSRVNRIQQRRKARSFSRRFFLLSLYFFLITGAISIFSGPFASKNTGEIISPAVASLQKSVDKSIKGISTLFSSGLQQTVETSLEGTTGTYAVYIKNLKTGEHYALRENEQFTSASLYKLWTMGAVYTQIEEGKLEKDDVLSASVESLNKQFGISTEEAELTEGTITKTVDDAVEQMITISHNYSAILLTSKVKLETVRDFLSTYGLDDSVVGKDLPVTTAADIGKYYELLYNKKIVNEIYSDEMMSRLKRQKLNDRIPKLLPKDTVVAHKTGEIYGFKHDAGIVFAPKSDYIIVMLSNSKNPAAAADRMAQLSKDVYDYFESK
jgi:beta-lactamase class A